MFHDNRLSRQTSEDDNPQAEQSIKHDRAQACHLRLKELLANDAASAVEAGRHLEAIKRESLWIQLGAGSWEDYVKRKLKVTLGWANNRIAIAEHFGDVAEEKLPNVTKMLALVKIMRVEGKKKREQWIERSQKMTTDDVIQAAYTRRGMTQAPHKQLTFRCSDDEQVIVESAIEKARKTVNLTKASALAFIANFYLTHAAKT